MNERILTTFYPKIKKSRINQKVASMSKLDLTEKINNSNFDYFNILSQIKAKNKQLGNSTLLHNFLLKNKPKQNYLRYKLINKKTHTQTALITEPSYDKKNHSHKKISKNLTYSEINKNNKSKLLLKRKLKTPRQINKILKLEEEKKIIRQIKLSKKKEPIECSISYKDYVEKINQYNFVKYSNSNSDYAHNIKSSFYIDKINDSLKKEKKSNDKYILKEKERMEDEKELRDKVFYPSLEIQKISKQIKLILGNENKFGQIENQEHFFDNYENRINFLFDNYKPPNIKNNLTKIKFEDLYSKKKNLNLINRIGNSAINFASNAKIKIQRERDERIIFLNEKNKITQKYGYYKKLSSGKIYNSKEAIEKIIYKNYYLKNEDDDIIQQKETTITLDEIFEKKNYFEDKIEKYDKVCIAEPRLRKSVFDILNYNNKAKKNSQKIIKFMFT